MPPVYRRPVAAHTSHYRHPYNHYRVQEWPAVVATTLAHSVSTPRLGKLRKLRGRIRRSPENLRGLHRSVRNGPLQQAARLFDTQVFKVFPAHERQNQITRHRMH